MNKSGPPSKPSNPFPDLPLASDDYKLLADEYPLFLEALELLYVGENLSGRLMFLKEWPHAAQFIFGFELIEYDIKGAPDIARRRTLEDEADVRRAQFLDLLSDIENKSVDKGALKKQHIEYVVNTIGLEAAQYVYTQRTLEKLYPSVQPLETPISEPSVTPAPPPIIEEPPPAPSPPVQERQEEAPEIKLGPRVPAYKPHGDDVVFTSPVMPPPVPETPRAPPAEPEPKLEEKPRPKIRLFKKPNIVGPPPRVKKPPPESAS